MHAWLLTALLSSQAVQAQAMGLKVIKPDPAGKKDDFPVYENPGTTLALRLSAGDWAVLEVDEDKSKIAVFTDDKGTNLNVTEGAFGGRLVGPFSKMGPEGKFCYVDLNTRAVPAPGAKTLKLEGTLAVTLASGQEKLLSKPVEAKEKTAFEAGGIPFTIESVAEGTFGDKDKGTNIDIKTDKYSAAISGLSFQDASGKPIEFKPSGWGGGGTYWSWQFSFKGRPAGFVVVLKKWKETRQVLVPVKLEAGVGL